MAKREIRRRICQLIASRRPPLLALLLVALAAGRCCRPMPTWRRLLRRASELARPWASTRPSPSMVKLYGAGGFEGLEAYQSGFLVSAEGHILTAWSYVLDTDYLAVMLADGRKFEAKLVGADPRLEIAVLKIDAHGLDHFDLATASPAKSAPEFGPSATCSAWRRGDEADSVQHGVVAAKTQLDARRGVYETPYHGPIYVVDCVTNNPGAAGGALVNLQRRTVGNARQGAAQLAKQRLAQLRRSARSVSARRGRYHCRQKHVVPDKPTAREGDGIDLDRFGIVMVPDVLERTPPYVEQVRAATPAAHGRAEGRRPDRVCRRPPGAVAPGPGRRAEAVGIRLRSAVARDARPGIDRSRCQTTGR